MPSDVESTEKRTDATPALSLAVACTSTVPVTVAPSVGAVSWTSGASVSGALKTVMVTVSRVDQLAVIRAQLQYVACQPH